MAIVGYSRSDWECQHYYGTFPRYGALYSQEAPVGYSPGPLGIPAKTEIIEK